MATRSASGTVRLMMLLLKVLLPLLALLFLLNFVYAPSCARFSCGYEPYWLPQAKADTGVCPDKLKDVWSNAGWAAERYSEVEGSYQTTGRYYDEDGKPHKIMSGDLKGADAERARTTLRQVGAPTARDGSYPAASHVEVKIAAMMREAGQKAGLVVINNDDGPCFSDRALGLSCQDVLPLVLAPGATLRVWWHGDGTMRFQDFTGR